MKVGIMGTRGIPNNYGGFEQFAQFISLGLQKRGHSVWVYNSASHPYREKEWNGVNLIHCRDPENKWGTIGQFSYDYYCIKDAREREFSVLFHLGYSSDSCWYWRWPKDVVNIINMDGLEWKRTKYKWLTRKFLKWAEQLAARHAQIMIADSPAIQEYIQRAYGLQPVYIPYAAEIFTSPDPGVLHKYKLRPRQYYMLVARMEPENNIEMIIQGFLRAGSRCPLLIIGNTGNKFGNRLMKKYNDPAIHFAGSIYDKNILDHLRYYAAVYFHGHSVGGTNPSLLEAMACNCNIVAHNNVFNRAVLGDEAIYFTTANHITAIINTPEKAEITTQKRSLNIEKIRTSYNPDKIIDAYEQLLLNALR